MLTLRVMHAHEGDCLLLVHGNHDRYLLVDGGPRNTFVPHLQPVLGTIQPKRITMCLSHVDTDHTTGLTELLAELRDQDADGTPRLVDVDALWINTFSDTIDPPGSHLRGRFEAVMQAIGPQSSGMHFATAALDGVQHGHALTVLAKQLGITIRQPWVAGATAPFAHHDLQITVVGPTAKNLASLRAEWQAWLDRQEERIAAGRIRLAANADKSVPNLSSIQLLVETGGKRLLLTGDGRGDHLLDALQDADLLDADGAIDVDVLKVQHHGSDRNATLGFFERVRAATYVISADGKNDNPDVATLQWIHKAAQKQNRTFELVLTNRPPDVAAWLAAHPQGPATYSARIRPANQHAIDVPIA